jgi:hypothetical protein
MESLMTHLLIAFAPKPFLSTNNILAYYQVLVPVGNSMAKQRAAANLSFLIAHLTLRI